MRGHAEIVGGGLAGLTAAVALAQRGWSVRVHERGAQLREIGAGLFLKPNSLQALDALGVGATGLARAERLQFMDISDTTSRRVVSRDVRASGVRTVLRTDLHRALAAAAIEAGVSVRTSSEGVRATPDGMLTTASGEAYRADLVVGADGVHSCVRESLGLGRGVKVLPEGATRLLVPRGADERAGRSVEYWSQHLRLLAVPCSPEHLYLALMAPENDRAACALPVDVARWRALFPGQTDLLDRLDPSSGKHHTNVRVQVSGWSSGRCCILGDAAHGQPPNLGQGAGLSIANSVALAAHLEATTDVESALRRWEGERRPLASMVQRWSYWYGVVAYRWPRGLYGARLAGLERLNRFGPFRRRFIWLWQGGVSPQGS